MGGWSFPRGRWGCCSPILRAVSGLWEADREAMAVASARLDGIVREQMEVADGQVFAAVGESFRAVFADPSAALGCAVAVQRAVGG